MINTLFVVRFNRNKYCDRNKSRINYKSLLFLKNLPEACFNQLVLIDNQITLAPSCVNVLFVLFAGYALTKSAKKYVSDVSLGDTFWLRLYFAVVMFVAFVPL
jgi:hypothetical protein